MSDIERLLENYGRGYRHEVWCQHKADNHGGSMDVSKLIAGEYMMHRVAGVETMGKFLAFDLQDGSSDHTLYDTYRDAVRHQHHNENRRLYIRMMAPSMSPCEAYVMLKTARGAHDNGLRLADPDHRRGGRSIIHRVSIEDALAASNGMPTNLRFSRRGQN
jgi:hypothetical protein